MKLNKFPRIRKASEEGAWVGHLPHCDEDVALLVRGRWNSDVLKIYADARAAMSEEEWGSDDTQRALENQAILEAILQDWHGFEDENGNPAEFDRDLIEVMLADPDYAYFRMGILWAADRVAERGRDSVEDALKN